MRVAATYWIDNELYLLADKDDLEGITRRINGGLNGLDDRRRWLTRFKQEYGA
jgi:putative chitinase